ncbi:hypothetical protein OMK64_11280 [Cellulomonas fimi]|uniref:hypothetical protein n=1 Tax=Cellulomonas fimi TaxID=1708 RepID=UPI00234CA9FA|nr:hypothetical protein [Cellulomonas fimi]MDC7122121.1 hypothetical protein [Cellulomonas fimi]
MTDPSAPTSTLVPEHWRTTFVLELRDRGADGRAVGEALAEVEQFCADSGQTAADAFGDARTYAASRVDTHAPRFAGVGRELVPAAVGVVGLLLLLWAVGADGPTLDVTVGRVLLPLVLVGGAVATVQVAVRSRLALAGTVAALLVALVVLDRVATAPLVTTTAAVAAVVGAVLLLAEAGWQTWIAVRRPEHTVVVAPGSDPRDERRRNVRAGIALAWLLPAMAAVAAAFFALLRALLP